MSLPRLALLALCMMPLCVPGGVSAQEDKWGKPVDLKQLIPPLPPIVPMPRNYDLSPGTVGGRADAPAPLQSPGLPATQSAPGIRFSIPSR
jgi:hypothetical protein